MERTIRQPRDRKALSVILAAILAFSLAAASIVSRTSPAYAATGTLTVGGEADYAGWSTTWFWVDGDPAYCGNPAMATPAPGSYNRTGFTILDPTATDWDYQCAYAIMYYGYGGPGFDPSMWPSTWYDGSGWNDDRYMAVTHINIADRYAFNAWSALYGCDQSFCAWWAWNFFSDPYWNDYYGNGWVTNGGGFYKQAEAAWAQLPDATKSAFVATIGVLQTGPDSQNIVTWVPTIPPGDFALQKASADPTMTGGNDCYSLEGAAYGVYNDAAATSLVGYIATDANGYAKTAPLSVGTYYVKESAAPKGYLPDPAVYAVEVTPNTTAHVNGGTVTDIPGNDPVGMLVGKKDADTGQMVAQGGASLAGAQFTVEYYDGYYADAASARASGQATRTWVYATDADGMVLLTDKPIQGEVYTDPDTGFPTLPYGTYVYYETKAPTGYLLPDVPSTFVTRVVFDASLPNGEAPDYVPYTRIEGDHFPIEGNVGNSTTVQAEKAIRGGVKLQKSDDTTGTAQGEASLAGITFAITSNNPGPVVVEGKTYTDGQVVKVLVTDASGLAGTAADTLPYGTYTVAETATNQGYLNTSSPITFNVRTDGQVTDLTPTAKSGFADKVVRGGVSILKLDQETGLNGPLGGATIDGAVFNIVSFNPNPVVVDGKSYTNGQVVATIVTQGGKAATAKDALPYGTYEVREVAPPAGYLISSQAQRFSIRQDGVVVELTGDKAISDQVVRGDLELVKVEAKTMAHMGGVPFEIRSDTTGEAHVLLTDENGFASTAASWNPHTQETNRGQADTDGVWFGLAPDGSTAPVTDALGALPYDTYTLTELPCAANEGKDMVSFQVVVKRNTTVIDLGTVTNEAVPKAEVRKTDATGAAEVPGAHLRLTRADGTLVDEWVSGDAPHVISPIAPGAYELEETIAPDGYMLAHSKVPFIVTAGQPVTQVSMTNELTPTVGTTARDADSGTQNVVAKGDATIIDTVAYTNLVPGKTYTVKGTLMDKATGEPLLVGGQEVTSEATFTPTEPDGTVDVTFTFDTSALGGTSVVVFEGLYDGDYQIAAHADIDDGGQTVDVVTPEVGTTAKDADSGTQIVIAKGNATVIDTVSYTKLVPGKTYTVKGTLMDKASDQPLLVGGQEVTSEATFTPDSPDGIVEVAFTFDASALGGASVVVFEGLYDGDYQIAAHADITDGGQTVDVVTPEVGTSARDAAFGTQNVVTKDTATIIDTVSYTKLVPGKTCTVKGTLMDKSTEEPLLVDGQEVTSEATFTPDMPDGTVEVTFTFDASGLGQATVVVFEGLYDGDFQIAAHADIDDEGQTVTVSVPKIGTTAADKATGGKDVVVGKKATIIDTVSYENLLPGKEYTVKGILMDKSTGEPLLVDGNEVTSEATFTPDTPDGTVEVTFTFDTSGLAPGTVIVVFETAYDGDTEVAAHADIDDQGQTVVAVAPPSVPATPAPSGFPKTGDEEPFGQIALVVLAVAAVLLAALTLLRIKHRKAQERQGIQGLEAADADSSVPVTVVDDDVAANNGAPGPDAPGKA